MTDLRTQPGFVPDARQNYVADEPVDFETWLALSLAADRREPETELRRGVIVHRMSAQFPHEWIFAWLFKILGSFVSNRKLGIVLGSRSAVKISDIDGRLPDLLFIREDNRQIIHTDAIYGAPDLVIEIVSANDRRKDLAVLEADYRAIGVTEIVTINPKRKLVRLVRKIESGYDETVLTTGPLQFACIEGFRIEVEWLFVDEKPDEFTVIKQLIAAAESQSVR